MQETGISQAHRVVVFRVVCGVQRVPQVSISRAYPGLGLGDSWEEVPFGWQATARQAGERLPSPHGAKCHRPLAISLGLLPPPATGLRAHKRKQ